MIIMTSQISGSDSAVRGQVMQIFGAHTVHKVKYRKRVKSILYFE